jgi:hypothetical protein
LGMALPSSGGGSRVSVEPELPNDARQSDEAIEQRDEADEAGASDGASQLIPGVRPTVEGSFGDGER